MLPDIDHVSDLIRQAAETEILPRFKALEAHQIREKSPGDFVTEADTETEKLLSRLLPELLPGSLVVGEEAVAADPRVLDLLSGDQPVWIIDPVDGTRNFAHGTPVFGVIVALVMGARTMAGWIHDPVNGVMATAVRGQGSWLDGRRVTIPAESPLDQMTGSLGFRRNKPLQAAVKGLIRHGSAAHDYLEMLRGRLDFAYYKRLNPWDHAAGILMFTEAGGFCALLDGTPYRPLPSNAGGALLAPGRQSWEELRPLIAQTSP
ncbi:inositol monophosphatase [Telmatospirillum sp. J64-1]|uniref:inositol monophosphatase family protein n=1 Tax=Telmatospirillum sp. J64-1 TaxID=2502183 RepID=UPI00115DB00D|nr:inositol monophosphatase [Telmatospirillum sp. J64-1]